MTNEGPSRAHLWLAKSVGSWSVAGRYFVGASADPIDASGSELVEMFGPYWRRGHLEIDLLGTTVRGCTCLGFDPLRQLFLSTWYDTSNPHLYSYQGHYDEKADVLVLTGSNTDPATGQLALYRSEERFALPDRRTLDLFIQAPGRPEVRVLTYELERRR